MTNILDELAWRGALNQLTDEAGLRKLTTEKHVGIYVGTDPTGDSLHVGHLIPFMMLKRFQLMGHKPVIVIGGGTGSIGDPSGRNSERVLQTMATIDQNKKKLTAQMERLFGTDNFRIVDNYSWLSKLSMLDFLRDYGKLFPVNQMLAKEVVASRLKDGISYTEFTYQILQSIDFLHLYQHEDVQVQLGGADQWGNITAGIDLIHKVLGADAEVYGLTNPLMLKSDGTKFGKSAGGAVYLDPEKTSPYEFYQFWFNQDDADVEKFLKFFTFLSQADIADLVAATKAHPERREAQRRLAQEVTTFVHGPAAVTQAEAITAALFSGEVQDLTAAEIEQGFKQFPTVTAPRAPENIVTWLVDTTGIESSRRQAREDVQNGAITINGTKQRDLEFTVDPTAMFDGRFVIVRRGKKKYFLVRVGESA
ncbi:tyrosine--tRNA ligase [Lacticaseibacillus nasuensis]|uniref:Tyrosine--tRNA ligase n=1 Tax=Lacticaseibacillus nasuensis JCM 17158 TaxID=1291734 RepID=A0A0R1JI53_9LACO|nr:tyrosine--tRNA ligase [Lacticaseibacillus nasuensis]KRK70872.1 tyrosine--tRNA ligase [Lacticaseibacillus nasuensis JCM 17158]